MRDVVIALLPAALVGIYNFRLSAVLVILTTCVTCMLSEYIWQKCMKQPVTTGDFSALLTGLLLALNLPATIPLWMCVVGGVFAHYRCQADVWRTGSELYESGTGRKMFHDAVFQ